MNQLTENYKSLDYDHSGRLARDIAQLVAENGLDTVLAALAGWCYQSGMVGPFRRLFPIVKWLRGP